MYSAIFDTVTEAHAFADELERIHGKKRLVTKPIDWTGEKAILRYTILPTPHDEFKKFMDAMYDIDPFFNPYE